MARVRSEQKYHTFVKGLVTEASPLTYPDNASLDEDNFVLKRDGSRERRLGIDYEPGFVLTSTGYDATSLASGKQSFHKWESPDGDNSVSLGVVRVGDNLWFLDLLTSNPSANLLNGGLPLVIPELGNANISTTVVNNYLVIASADLKNPIALFYNRITGLIERGDIVVQVRDLWGVVDGLRVDERPTTLTKLHEYNLRNQGWHPNIPTVCAYPNYDLARRTSTATGALGRAIDMITISAQNPVIVGAIQCTFDQIGGYPSNADIWSLGKIADSSSVNFEKYDPATMKKNSLDNMEAPRGSFVLNAFERGASRRLLLGDDTLPLDKENGCITTIASYAGRVFYAGVNTHITDGDTRSPTYSNCIFFSQIVTDPSKLGLCFQEADPTSDRISDLVDTDGGVIQIPEATNIVRLVPARTSLLVFAENGVWEVFGNSESGFTATGYQASKISSNGCSSPRSVVEASGSVLAWTRAGIYLYTVESSTGRYVAQNLSMTTVQTLYNRMSNTAKDYAVGFYDEKENTVRWLYNDTEEYSETEYLNRYNRELLLDLTLQAFYQNSVDISVGPYIVDYIDVPSYTTVSNEETIYVGADSVYVDLEAVIIDSTIAVARASQFSFLVIAGTDFTVAKYNNRNFVDWIGYNGTGADFVSYLLTGHEDFGSVGSKKQIPYLWTHFRRTETGFVSNNGGLDLNYPSGCTVQAKWDWTDSANSGKWGVPFQVYKLLRHYIPQNSVESFDYGYEVIVTKSKLRGSGRSLSLLFTSESGKDMKLLGWSMLVDVGR